MSQASLRLHMSTPSPEETQAAIDSLDSLIQIFFDIYGSELAMHWQFYKPEPQPVGK